MSCIPRLCFFALAWLAAVPVAAWPVLDEAESFGSVRLLPDHEDRTRFYTLVDRLVLDQAVLDQAGLDQVRGVDSAGADRGPALRFDRYRYVGSTVLDDVGELWARGVLTFRVRLEADPADLERAAARARRLGGLRASLQPLPPAEVRASVVYVVVDGGEGNRGTSGTLPATAATEGTVWDSRTLAVGLGPHTAQLLWTAFHRDAVALSVSYSVAARGLPRRPDAAAEVRAGGGSRSVGSRRVGSRTVLEGTTEEAGEPVVRTLGGGALPIRVSPAECPPCFASIDLDAQIPAAFTTVTVFCHDFDLERSAADLVEVRAEVRATSAVEGRVVRSTRFEPEGERRGSVHFPVAVRLDDGFEYRALRIYGDAHVEASEWRSAPWSRVLDITRRAPPRDGALDPRELY